MISRRSSILPYRSILKIAGPDSSSFLQGVLSNDIYKVQAGALLYSLLLTPQGKILYDFFITPNADGFLVDCPAPYLVEVMKLLRLYKLRQKIEITEISEYKAHISQTQLDESFMLDPRTPKLGYRSISSVADRLIDEQVIDWYQEQRIKLKVPEAHMDFIPEMFFPIHLGLNRWNAIDYNKGCYIGQEVTARSTYRGNIRKELYCLQFQKDLPEWGQEVFLCERKAGIALGCYNKLGLALLNIEEVTPSCMTGHTGGVKCVVLE